MSIYAPKVREYFSRDLPPDDGRISATAGSVRQGVWVRLTGDLESGKLVNMGFRAFACPHIIALCQRLTEVLDGSPEGALAEVSLDKLAQEFQTPVEKAGKLLILKDALEAFRCQCGDSSGAEIA